MALRVQLVIVASAFVAGSTLWWVSCLPQVVLRTCKSGGTPDPLYGAWPLGYGVG